MYINKIDFEDFTKDVVIDIPEDTLKCVSVGGIPNSVIECCVVCTHFKYEKYP